MMKNKKMTTEQIKHIIIPILKKYGIIKAGLFGSYAKNENTENSDVDILVEIGSPISLLEYVKIKLELEDSLNKKVDLVEYQAIKTRLEKNILAEEIRIYG